MSYNDSRDYSQEVKVLAFICGVIVAAVGAAMQQLAGIANHWAAWAFLVLIPVLCPFKKEWLGLGLGFIWYRTFLPSHAALLCHDTFWFLCQEKLEYEPGARFLLGTWPGHWLPELRQWLAFRCLQWHPIWGPWALGMLGGRIEGQTPDLLRLYTQLGLMHVLVISGSHFTFLGRCLEALVAWPARLLYVGRLLSFRVWLSWHLLSQAVIWATLALYALIVGFSPPCQRAFLGFLLRDLTPLILGRTRPGTLLLGTAFLQALLFPLSFVSLSNALSWSAAAVLMRYPSHFWRPSLSRELMLAFCSLAYFGYFSPIGIFLNPLLEPVWGPILVLAVIGCIGNSMFQHLASEALELFHRLLSSMQQLQLQLWTSPALAWTAELALWGRLLSWFFTLVVLALALAKSSEAGRKSDRTADLRF